MVSKLADQYQKNGFVSGIQIISMREAWAHRNRLEHAENQVGLCITNQKCTQF